MARDITEQKNADAAVRQLNARLEAGLAELSAANKDLETFNYTVSHDLRAPLRAIDGFSRLLGDCASALGPEGARLLAVIRSNTEKIGELFIDDLLNLSRLGRQALRSSEIDMGGLFRTAWEDLRACGQAGAAALTLAELPKAWGDQALVREAVFNLLSNAAKYYLQDREAGRGGRRRSARTCI